jgi:hypothetical protein
MSERMNAARTPEPGSSERKTPPRKQQDRTSERAWDTTMPERVDDRDQENRDLDTERVNEWLERIAGG